MRRRRQDDFLPQPAVCDQLRFFLSSRSRTSSHENKSHRRRQHDFVGVNMPSAQRVPRLRLPLTIYRPLQKNEHQPLATTISSGTLAMVMPTTLRARARPVRHGMTRKEGLVKLLLGYAKDGDVAGMGPPPSPKMGQLNLRLPSLSPCSRNNEQQ
ncbi:uncharacterized protein EV422DRAFT_547950 [Fimicolochytrium jonesii]|uniref:uncharacterized protein n=1 Tax=Fimicolochytrium jonesii TaxID=1396493 RepID=UPI0022FEA048|nr:uncharacterized protein EV422DRAFT_547950 [Fimicolochytrium jonesii]KAI8815884.1 hypothetical protein EV422DRAFT_547950 [Fimicolochytrium jonesii]